MYEGCNHYGNTPESFNCDHNEYQYGAYVLKNVRLNERLKRLNDDSYI